MHDDCSCSVFYVWPQQSNTSACGCTPSSVQWHSGLSPGTKCKPFGCDFSRRRLWLVFFFYLNLVLLLRLRAVWLVSMVCWACAYTAHLVDFLTTSRKLLQVHVSLYILPPASSHNILEVCAWRSCWCPANLARARWGCFITACTLLPTLQCLFTFFSSHEFLANCPGEEVKS